jgi:hypothetical protein
VPPIRVLTIILAFLALGHAIGLAADDPMRGFALASGTDFAPILELASPGPHRAERAIALLDRQLVFQRQALHPEYGPTLEHLFEKYRRVTRR